MSIQNWPGGRISSVPPIPSGPFENSTASGVWTIQQAADYVKQGIWPTAGNRKDPFFNYVTMLLHGDGTNGAQNNTFLDSSANNFTITRNGNTTQGSFSPYGPNWSNFFNGSSSYLTTPSNVAFEFGTGNFTIEFWIYLNAYTPLAAHIVGPHTQNVGADWWVVMTDTGQIVFNIGNGSPSNPRSTGNVSTNTWTHVAIVKNSGVYAFYINGAASGTNANTDFIGCSRTIGIGAPNNGGLYFTNGYISNLRVVKGTAVYTAAFTPSTTPLTAISGTSLLTCADNRFIDDSTNNFTITAVGAPSVQRFNPFGAATEYSTSVIGGSGYFDGSGDYLATPSLSALSGSFTIEFWVNLNAKPGAFIGWMGGTAANTQFFINTKNTGNGVRFGLTGVAEYAAGSFTWPLNTWNHVAVVRNGTDIKIYVNGTNVSDGTYTNSTSYSGVLQVAGNIAGTVDFNGYLTNLRILNGTALYTSNFTPPTAPLTAVTNTQLLLNYTNGAIFDNAMMNDLETVGNAQISTSVKKYGTGSLAFDGTGDLLVAPVNPDLNLGAGDFTLEMWVNPSTVSPTFQGLIVKRRTDTVGTGAYALYIASGGSVVFQDVESGSTVISFGTLSASTWAHIAVTRSGSTVRGFINGSLISSASSTRNFTSNWLTLIGLYGTNGGEYPGGTPSGPYTGFIDDLRITKGVARYTATFTPPTQAFPNLGPT